MLMAIPAERMAARAAAWAESDAAVRAVIVYGSLAQGSADDDSDLDVVVVAEPGQREGLWGRREEISDLIHGHHAVWHQEPLWQRPYRYQSWDEELTELDLTLDEEHASPWAALTRGFLSVVDKAEVAARLRSDLAAWQPSEFDAPAFDGGTWVWLNYLRGKLRHGEAWMVRYGVMDTLNSRVLPLLGTAGHSAHHSLEAADIDRIHRAAPASSEPAELRRSLRATAELYAWALDRWSQRTGLPVPQSPLAPAIMAKLHTAED
jgi:predicted nucleotidyltransferase